MEEFDAIIVGAGPAGLVVAEKLAAAGSAVLCLDKKQEIGSPKRCAEGLGIGSFTQMNLKPDKQWAVQPIHGACLYAPSGKKLELRFPQVSGYVLDRKQFEKFLAKKAAKAGALIKVKANAKRFSRQHGKVIVEVQEMDSVQEYAAPLIIAADGVESLTARKLGLNTTLKLNDIDSGFQYEMTNIVIPDEDLIHLYFGTEIAQRGYCWIFPKGKQHANVGIGITGLSEKSAKYYLDKWIASKEEIANGSIVEVNAGCIPVGGFLQEMTADNLMVVGDAAHQVNPIHGGGIGLAMEAAAIAAIVADKAIEEKNFSNHFLSEYNKIWWKQRGIKLQKVLKMRHMLESMDDKTFEILAASLTGKDLLRIAEGDLMQSAKIVTKKLVKHPGLVKVMLKYLRNNK